MRILLLGAATLALSGCSWLGLGNNHNNQNYNYNAHNGNYSYQAQPKANKGCHSGQCLSRWNLEGAIGPSFNIASTKAVGAEGLNPGTTTVINDVKARDAYQAGYRAELGGSYALSPNRKVTANAFIDRADSAGPQNLGTIGGETLIGSLSDYEAYGGEVGLRQYFAPRRAPLVKSIRPYVEAKLGATYLDDVALQDTELGGAAFSATDIPFYESGWVGSAAGMVGVETPLTKYSTIALETGVRYTQGPKSDNTVLAPGFSIAGTNNGGSRTTIPVMLRGRYRF